MTAGGTPSTLDAISAHHASARCHPPRECQLRQQLYTTHMTEELKHHNQQHQLHRHHHHHHDITLQHIAKMSLCCEVISSFVIFAVLDRDVPDSKFYYPAGTKTGTG